MGSSLGSDPQEHEQSLNIVQLNIIGEHIEKDCSEIVRVLADQSLAIYHFDVYIFHLQKLI